MSLNDNRVGTLSNTIHPRCLAGAVLSSLGKQARYQIRQHLLEFKSQVLLQTPTAANLYQWSALRKLTECDRSSSAYWVKLKKEVGSNEVSKKHFMVIWVQKSGTTKAMRLSKKQKGISVNRAIQQDLLILLMEDLTLELVFISLFFFDLLAVLCVICSFNR